MIALQPHAEGTVVPIAARPGAKNDAVSGAHGGALRVAVSAPPDKGKANEALRTLLAGTLGIRPGDVRLLSGATGRRKRLLIIGLAPREVRARLDAALRDPRDSSSRR